MKLHCFRLLPHQDLKQEILRFARLRQLQAGCIVTCVGSLEAVHLRYAHQQNGSSLKGFFEIISLPGTISLDAVHLHLSVSDSEGKTTGGHLLAGNLIYTTAEIVLAEIPDTVFLREKDNTYGYAELVVKDKISGEG